MTQPYYTIKQLAEALGISHQAVWERIKRGTIQGERWSATWVIPRAEYDRLTRTGNRRHV